ncbi:hypothetical protein BEN30_00905 [Magnetovibrio blakemorei]|uniref:Carboxypeptidase regulatory-like domain-containing protein n=2 Tax=Magnetovibrio blakemorei TaxID=28181 RepID=A0A1E5Q4C2_9PROT|nr:hypothetical protein BEN30_00905 [Magnetovibrio blakemorei]
MIVLGFQADALAQISPSKPLPPNAAAAKPLYKPETAFSTTASAWALKEGTSTIAGQGFLKAQGGFIQTAAGETVTLVPKSPYTDEIVSITRKDGFFEEYSGVQKDPEYEPFRRVITADKNGAFRFEGLPAGEWYIATRVIWFTRDQLGNVALNGGLLWGVITTVEGQALENIKLNSTDELLRYGPQ